jgi:hypothetical protein
MQRLFSLVFLMGVLLVSMSADAFILLMPTGGVPPSCFTAPAQDAVTTGNTAPWQIAGPASPTFPITLCP